MTSVAICIPSIPPRASFLERAIASIYAQEFENEIAVDVRPVVELDHEHTGAWATRNRALQKALLDEPDWIGFLDDDDELYPWHVDHLLTVADSAKADMVWGWFQIVYGGDRIQPDGVGDPFAHIVGPNGEAGYRGREYDPALPHIVPITYMVRASVVAQAVEEMGGFQPDTIGSWDMQDQPLIDKIYELTGGALYASSLTTWKWHHHGANTSGMPGRWL